MKRIALATFVALGLAASAAAQEGNDRTNQVPFDQADRDNDGFNFSAADADDDRWLSRAEFQTPMSESRPRG
ncbi:MAG: hypothetical protein EHM50_07135 [Lysobacterales bacterium]|nr:MAG: hypothetical protein EHM50_07135 [Xanthomonadales bacterium]